VKLSLAADDKGPLQFSLVRLLCDGVETDAGVLYLHDFSDFFWCKEIAHNFVDDGYHFYAIDFRKYGRSIRDKSSDDRPNFVTTLSEYYEEIHSAIQIMRKFDRISKILLVGQGLGGLIATLYMSDHPEKHVEVQGLCLLSPFFALNRNWVDNIANLAKNWVGSFDPNFVCKNFSRLYHETLHKDFHGEWSWDLTKKPLDGFPLYAGWLQMVAESQRRVGLGLDIRIPILVLLSSGSLVAKDFTEDVLKYDIIMNVKIAKDTSERLGPNVQVDFLKEALHDILASKEVVREQAYDLLFDRFNWMVENVPVDDANSS